MQSLDIVYKLQRLALGNETDYSLPENVDWKEAIQLSYVQAVPVQVCEGLEILYEKNPDLNLELDTPKYENMRFEWCGQKLILEHLHKKHNKRVIQLTRMFADIGFRTCLLKGQGCALMYPDPLIRNCGDIDLWVEGGRKKILSALKPKWKISHIVNHHAKVEFFNDVSVEIHYVPAWLYNPFNNRKLQRFFKTTAESQFSNMTDYGFAVPTVRFNLVYLSIHLYKHIYEGNATIKQMTDYYYLLKASSYDDRRETYEFLKKLGMGSYVAYLMSCLHNNLGLSDDFLLCTPSNKRHRPVSELLWLYPWKIGHFIWRLFNGYLFIYT